MAAWQYNLWVVPSRKITEFFGEPVEYIGLDTFERFLWWQNEELPSNYESLLDNFLPRSNNPLTQHEVSGWGDIDSNWIEISFLEDAIEQIFIRIDAREVSDPFINGIVNFSEICEAVFYLMEEKKFLEPNAGTLREHLLASRAKLFTEDPNAFFKLVDKLDFSPQLK